MTVRTATPPMGFCQASGQQIVGQLELVPDLMLALAEAGRLRAFRGDLHLQVLIHAERKKYKIFLRIRK